VARRTPSARVRHPSACRARRDEVTADVLGWLALSRYVAALDTVFVLAVRAQREGGYRRQ